MTPVLMLSTCSSMRVSVFTLSRSARTFSSVSTWCPSYSVSETCKFMTPMLMLSTCSSVRMSVFTFSRSARTFSSVSTYAITAHVSGTLQQHGQTLSSSTSIPASTCPLAPRP